MTADELQAAIDRAEMNWRDLRSQAAHGRPLSKLDPVPDGGLMAHGIQNVAALVDGLGTCGSGGRIWAVPSVPQAVRVK